MKKLKVTQLIIFTFIICLGMISCSEDDVSNADLQTRQQIESNMITGNWAVTKFIESGKDETHHFNNYNFIFDNNGVLTSTNGIITYEGSWSITDSNSNDDGTDDLDFNINFNLSNEFEDLNDDWNFISISASKIELFDVSGGNGDTDYLTFEKK